MNNLLVWTLNTNDPTTAVWVATGTADIRYNVLLGKQGIEGIVILPSGQVFVAAFEETETAVVDDMKAYLQAHHNSTCNIRDLSAKFVLDNVKKLADRPSIVLPPGSRS